MVTDFAGLEAGARRLARLVAARVEAARAARVEAGEPDERIAAAIRRDHAAAPAALGILRDAAAELVEAAEEDSCESVVMLALTVLTRVRAIVERELGAGWRRTVRPFGPLTGWGENAGKPITLADAVEYLAADRVQLRREADSSRRAASDAVNVAREARQEALDARRQVAEVRRHLEKVLRPNATRLADCDDCGDAGAENLGRCQWHQDTVPEPPLSDDLAADVDRLAGMYWGARDQTRQARNGRVSVYVDGTRVTGPELREPVLASTDEAAPSEPAEQLPAGTTGSGKTWGAAVVMLAAVSDGTFLAVGTLAYLAEVRYRLVVELGMPPDYPIVLDVAAADEQANLRFGNPHIGAPGLCQYVHLAAQGRMHACRLIDGHMGMHLGVDDQGRHRELGTTGLKPLAIGHWAHFGEMGYAGEALPVWSSTPGLRHGKGTLLFADGSRRAVVMDDLPEWLVSIKG